MRSYAKNLILGLCAAGSLSANLRAPIRIERGHTRLMAKPARVKVLGERLEFRCPASHTGKPDYRYFAESFCQATVTYLIEPQGDANVALAFVYAGGEQVEWMAGAAKVVSRSRALKKSDTLNCSFCPDDLRMQRVAEAELLLSKASREITVTYQQALDYDENGHGYFSDGIWTQGFTYELWPLAEWQWQQQVAAALRISIAARPGFLGIGYKKDRLSCAVRSGDHTLPVAVSAGDVVAGERQYTAQFELQKKPQRLHCYWSAE